LTHAIACADSAAFFADVGSFDRAVRSPETRSRRALTGELQRRPQVLRGL
jgi:hypothetical protein